MLNDTTNSYKYLFLLSLLDAVQVLVTNPDKFDCTGIDLVADGLGVGILWRMGVGFWVRSLSSSASEARMPGG